MLLKGLGIGVSGLGFRVLRGLQDVMVFGALACQVRRVFGPSGRRVLIGIIIKAPILKEQPSYNPQVLAASSRIPAACSAYLGTS